MRYYGVDFSGARDAGRRVWVATAVADGNLSRVVGLQRGQELPGSARAREPCLQALWKFISGQEECVVGLDFPFSLPAEVLPRGGWRSFVLGFHRRYPSAADFRQACRSASQGRELRRRTDIAAKTPWSAYNLRLYRQTYYGIRDVLLPLVRDRSALVIPFDEPRAGVSWVLEVCPASTLKSLSLNQPYKGRQGGREEARERIIRSLEKRRLVAVSKDIRDTVIADKGGDALDSVIAAIAALRSARDPSVLRAARKRPYLREGYVFI